MQLKDLENKNIGVWGLGNEGEALVRFLRAQYPDIRLKIFENDAAVQLDGLDIIIKSPGVSIYKPLLSDAKRQGIKFTSGTDLFFNEIRARHPHCKIIGVSGSKGKSTTSSLLYQALSHLKQRVGFGGNIGKPLIELLNEEYDYIVAEVSSYQAADLTASPHIILFTNLFPEHIDWHLSHENYYRDKIHLIANQKPGDIAFVNDRCEKLKKYVGTYPSLTKSFYNISEGFHAEGRELYYGGQKILDISETKLNGYHNLDNMAGVLSVIGYLGFDIQTALEALKDFSALPHRLQKFYSFHGTDFINDSISTAPETALAAMKSFDEDMLIVLGGYDRQQDYSELAGYIAQNPKVKAAVTLFQTGPRIAKTLREKVVRKDFCLCCVQNLTEAVSVIYQKIKDCGIKLVLFSPAAPSYDSYQHFTERGDDFMKQVIHQGNEGKHAA